MKIQKGITERIKYLQNQGQDVDSLLHSSVIPQDRAEQLTAILESNSQKRSDYLYAGLTVGDFIYDAVRIDSNVLKGAVFSRTEDLGDIFKFSVFADRVNDLSLASLEGNIHQIKGYVAERIVAQQLQSSGMEVEYPEFSNQPGYDLLVNGDPYQVKCLSDTTGVYNHFEKYPDIPVFVNEELAEELKNVDNVFPVAGLSNEDVEAATQESIEAGDELLDYEIPYISLAVAIGRNTYLFIKGQTDLGCIGLNIVYDFSGRAVGAKIGSTGMALMGGILGPYGVVIGGIIGAVTGSIWGRKATSAIKRTIHTSGEEKEAEEALKAFLKASFIHSLKAKKVFDNKMEDLHETITGNKIKNSSLSNYIIERAEDEDNYFNSKIDQLKISQNNPRILDPINSDIVICGQDALSLSLKSKVHPSSVMKELNLLKEKIELLLKKRNSLT